MKTRSMKITTRVGLVLGMAVLLLSGIAHAIIVHDPIHTAMNESKWAIQLRDMLTQIRRLEEQIDLYKKKIKQWDDDFKDIWGKTSGKHQVLHTLTQVGYAQSNPWLDIIRTGESMYNDFNTLTRAPGAAFSQVKSVRDSFGFVRPDLTRYRDVPAAVQDYYRALGNLSSEGLYVSGKAYGAAGTVWSDAERINEYSKDRSPAGAAKTAAFAASVQAYAAGYQLETQNRILKQLAYQNMQEENKQRTAIQATATLQEGLAGMYHEMPVKVHLIP